MKRFSSFHMSLLGTTSCAAVLALAACGNISDPSRKADGSVATVTGALTGTDVPANARVALVWRAGDSGGYAVGSDVAVTNGAFAMNLTPPPDSYFLSSSDVSSGSSSSGSSLPSEGNSGWDGEDVIAPDETSPAPAVGKDASAGTTPKSSSFSFANKLAPRGGGVSGTISKPLDAAVAGFVVYADTNGNGKLDISGPYAASTDEVIGGNDELVLAYLRNGSTLDYEDLRDSSGGLPKAGYNLMWTDKGRWLPLNAVDLTIKKNTELPYAVCGGSSSAPDGDLVYPDVTPVADGGATSTAGTPTEYPSPDDPALRCFNDGRAYYLEKFDPCGSQPAEPSPVGLCPHDVYETPPCSDVGPYTELLPGGPVPPGWPCVVAVTGPSDAGTRADASVPDDTADAGAP
ncbi:MAG TPA: hypothetical protein VM925_33545 [Labilithrix sp.]|nr:hypothetical protein [Labilithrix sp.]